MFASDCIGWPGARDPRNQRSALSLRRAKYATVSDRYWLGPRRHRRRSAPDWAVRLSYPLRPDWVDLRWELERADLAFLQLCRARRSRWQKLGVRPAWLWIGRALGQAAGQARPGQRRGQAGLQAW